MIDGNQGERIIDKTVSNWSVKQLRNETSNDIADVDALLDLTFGIQRFKRTVNLMRKYIAADLGCSWLYRDRANNLLGLCRIYRIEVDDGLKASYLGPVAVIPKLQGMGMGQFLIQHTIQHLTNEQSSIYAPLIFLVGSLAYYQRYGFSRAGQERYQMAGPVAPLELLTKALNPKGEKLIYQHKGTLSFIQPIC